MSLETVSPPAAARIPSADLRSLLRARCQSSHERLEQSLDLLRPDADAARFGALLSAFHGFHRRWEPALADALPQDARWLADRRRLRLIEDDLAALGWSAEAIAGLPACEGAAALCATPAAAMGTLYVLEGSTLGGKMIARHVAAQPWAPPRGLRYFDPYGADTGLRWRETLARLEAMPGHDWPAACDAAVACFDQLLAWLPPAAPRP